MDEALGLLRAYEAWIYLLLGIGGLYYIRKFILAWQELRNAGFGLERERAQSRLNYSASVLVLLLTMAVTEFVLVSFIAPSIPGAIPLLTPTVDVLATPTVTLSPLIATTTGQGTPIAPSTSPETTASAGCIPGQIVITAPTEGSEAAGVVDVLGTANIPNFAFYKLEMRRPNDPEGLWATLLAGNEPIEEASLGPWDTRRLPPGDYQLGLVVVDNEANASAHCVVQVRVVAPPPDTPAP